MDPKLINQLKQKFDNIGQNLETHLEGLLYSKPLTYWDYIQTDALLNLQIQRTTLPDEMVFIMYHQINELIFKMILSELGQVAENEAMDATMFLEKIVRITRYFEMLTTSFSIMKDGMDVEQYTNFRTTLTPASGFQSAQYRKIEFASTELINLIDKRFRDTFDPHATYNESFEHLYWQAAGKDYETGKKTYTLTVFEQKYKDEFIKFAKSHKTRNLWCVYKTLSQTDQKNKQLIDAMRLYDYTVNIKWVLVHYETANHYLNIGGTAAEATGGSEWVKYMHPKYQKRIFFPDLWTEKELQDWGKEV